MAAWEKRFVRRRTDHGAAAVEFAFVMIPLLMLVFGLIQYGFYFWAMQGGADIARDAARRAAVGNPVDCAVFKNAVTTRVNDFVGNGKVVSINRTFVQDPTITRAHATDVEVNDTVKVTVRFNSYDFKLPFVPFINNGQVSASADARVENMTTQPGSLICS